MFLSRVVCLFILCSSLSSYASEYDSLMFRNDRAFCRLRGAVAGITTQQWTPSPDSTVFSATHAVQVDKSYTMVSVEEKMFDQQGFLAATSIKTLEGRRNNKWKAADRIFYYRKGNLEAVADAEDNRKTDSVVYHYRKKGGVDYYRLFNSRHELVYKINYTYKEGRIRTARRKNEKDLPVTLMQYVYKDGRLVETRLLDEQSRNVEIRKYSVKQTVEGHLNESYSVSGADGLMKEGRSAVRDSLGNLLEQNLIDDQRRVTEYKGYQYDEQGNAVVEKIFSSFRELTITNRYTYDHIGNWTRKEVFYNGILNAVFLNEIRYEG